MIFKNSWVWIVLAAILLVLCVLHYQRVRILPPGPPRIVPQLKASAVTNIQVRIERQLQFHADRVKDSWALSEPVHYAADATRIQKLLIALEHLTPAIYISRRELAGRPNAEDEYGFGSPQATLFLRQPGYEAHLYIGARSAPGDQVFVQVVGDEGIYVVGVDLLNLIPQSPNDWRDRVLLDPTSLGYDRIAVTNSGKGFELHLDETNKVWRIVTSDFSARAEKARVDELLDDIRALRIKQFVSDTAGVDVEGYGLQNPDFQFALGQGTNTQVVLQFGKTTTNDANQVFARRLGQNTIVTVDRSGLNPWPAQLTFRDLHLVSGSEEYAKIEVQGRDNFSLVHLTNAVWRVEPQGFLADQESASNFLACLNGFQIVPFKDVVPEPSLSTYGLDHPFLKYTLERSPAGSSAAPATNAALGLHFGTNQEDKVWFRRTDEFSVSSLKPEDFQRLPSASWQFRNRQLWNFSINDLASLAIQQGGKSKQIVRTGDHQWSIAPGSQGIIDSIPVEETAVDLVDLSATEWLGHGEGSRAAYGFTSPEHTITLQFKNGEKRVFELGSRTSQQFPVLAAVQDGEPWVFRISPLLCRDILLYLSISVAAL